jgi:class 3 adenylate cyclase
LRVLDSPPAKAQSALLETNGRAAAREGILGAERVERRLAAILATDVAGYSRLMERDKAGTLARLRALRRDLIDPKIAEHKGRIVKTTGDGPLVEFQSVVEAVVCAVACNGILRQTITILARTSASNSASAAIRAL